MSIYYIGIIGMAIPSGKISELIGNIILFRIALLIIILFQLFMYFTNNFVLMLVSRIFIGVGCSITISMKNAMP